MQLFFLILFARTGSATFLEIPAAGLAGARSVSGSFFAGQIDRRERKGEVGEDCVLGGGTGNLQQVSISG